MPAANSRQKAGSFQVFLLSLRVELIRDIIDQRDRAHALAAAGVEHPRANGEQAATRRLIFPDVRLGSRLARERVAQQTGDPAAQVLHRHARDRFGRTAAAHSRQVTGQGGKQAFGRVRWTRSPVLRGPP